MADWHNTRAFVTGHTGFKGAWLSLLLGSLGAEVSGYALEPATDPSLFRVGRINEVLDSTIADIRDGESLRLALEKAAPEVVFHLAAQALVLPSYEEPVYCYETNVIGTAHLLEAVRHVSSVRAVVIVTSDKCYENKEWQWGYREIEPLGGADPYSSSKACAELVTRAYRRSFFSSAERPVLVASARAGNVIGGGDWSPYRLIPDAMKAFISGEELMVRSPAAVRPWQHVLDPLQGYVHLAERLLDGDTDIAGPFNFGPPAEEHMAVAGVVRLVADLWGPGARWSIDPHPSPRHEAGLLMLDATKAREALSWRPRLNLRQGAEWTVDWYRAFARGEDMQAFTRKQIDAYRSLDGSPREQGVRDSPGASAPAAQPLAEGKQGSILEKLREYVFISAWNDSGGGYLHRLLDGHPALAVWPFEIQLGTGAGADEYDSWFRPKYRWPRLVGDLAKADGAALFDSVIEDELKRVITDRGSARHHAFPVAVTLDAWRDRFVQLWTASSRTRADWVRAHIASFFDVWKERHSSGEEQAFLGHCPTLVLDADLLLGEMPDARIVHVHRSPFAGFADQRRRRPEIEPETFARKWTLVNGLAETFACKYPDRVRLVSFEALLADPAAEVSALCGWLDLKAPAGRPKPAWNGRPLSEDAMSPFGGVAVIGLEHERSCEADLSDREREIIDRLTMEVRTRETFALPTGDTTAALGARA